MSKRGFLARHGVVRNAVKADLITFALPALLVFVFGLIVSGRDGYDGLTAALWRVATEPQFRSQLSAANIAGLAFYLLGLTIAVVAYITLGKFYSSTLVTRKGHQLITRGLYRFLRHPIYLGVLIIIMGVPLYATSLFGFLVMSLLVPIFLHRIRLEERLLTEEFGDDYREYCKLTSKLIPFVY
jgi:protein-S-isoprenylcysteine O-methyltransferase Ste14